MRILAFSDLHRDERAGRSLVERSAQVDVVAGVGDFASMHHGLQRVIDVLSAINRPALLVPGNNETDGALRAACAGWPAAKVLHGEVTEIDDVTFFGLGGGVPVTPWDWSFDLTEQHAERMLTGLPPGAVLLVHSPPKGHVDGGLGSAAVLRAIQQRRPRLVLCGHVHECWAGKAAWRRAGAQPRPGRRRDRARRASVRSATCAMAAGVDRRAAVPAERVPRAPPTRSATAQSRRAPELAPWSAHHPGHPGAGACDGPGRARRPAGRSRPER